MSSSRRGSRERMTLATIGLGLGLAPPASRPGAAAAASCQAWETTVGHFMSHKERSARAVSRYFASSDITAVDGGVPNSPIDDQEDWLARLGGRFM
nr:unnamed protein product [Digitaria exilis]